MAMPTTTLVVAMAAMVMVRVNLALYTKQASNRDFASNRMWTQGYLRPHHLKCQSMVA